MPSLHNAGGCTCCGTLCLCTGTIPNGFDVGISGIQNLTPADCESCTGLDGDSILPLVVDLWPDAVWDDSTTWDDASDPENWNETVTENCSWAVAGHECGQPYTLLLTYESVDASNYKLRLVMQFDDGETTTWESSSLDIDTPCCLVDGETLSFVNSSAGFPCDASVSTVTVSAICTDPSPCGPCVSTPVSIDVTLSGSWDTFDGCSPGACDDLLTTYTLFHTGGIGCFYSTDVVGGPDGCDIDQITLIFEETGGDTIAVLTFYRLGLPWTVYRTNLGTSAADCCTGGVQTIFSEIAGQPCQSWTNDITVTITPSCNTAAQTSPVGLQAASGTTGNEGAIAQVSPMGTQSLTGKVIISGTIAQTSPVATQELKAPISGTIAQTSPVGTQSLVGTNTNNGTVAQTSPVGTQSLSGKVVISGTIAQTAVIETQAGTGATCATQYCEWECQGGGAGWVLNVDNCNTGCQCDTEPPAGECVEGVNEGETRQKDCVPA